jgi:hypothetical protein
MVSKNRFLYCGLVTLPLFILELYPVKKLIHFKGTYDFSPIDSFAIALFVWGVYWGVLCGLCDEKNKKSYLIPIIMAFVGFSFHAIKWVIER